MDQPDWYEPLIMPGLFTVFGIFVWWFAMMAEQKGKSAPWKWLGIVLLAIGIGFGFPYFSKMIGSSTEDVLYRQNLPSVRRYTYAHYAAVLLPLATLVICFVWQFFNKKPGSLEATAPAE